MKVSVIGAGQVGSVVAMRIAESDLANVTLVDIVEGLARGKALDLQQAASIVGHGRKIIGTEDYAEIEGSDIVVCACGLARKPGMSREDLLKYNARTVKEVVGQIVRYSPEAIILMVTNPLDPMTYLAYKVSGFGSKRVLGMSGILDSARFGSFIACELKVPVADVEAVVLGGHGDSMIPLPRHSMVRGRPLTELLPKAKIDSLVERTKRAGSEIVKFLRTGSAYFAPSASIYAMARSIILDEMKVFPASVYLEGQYGLTDIYLGVPARISRAGVGEIVELELDRDELDALHKSAHLTRESIKKIATGNFDERDPSLRSGSS